MNVLQRLIKSLRTQGIGATLAKLAGPAADRRFDRHYGTETCTISRLDGFTIESQNKGRGARYEPSRVLPMRKMLPVVQQLAPADSVLLDFGCGKGRVLLLAAEQGFRSVRGIEFAAELCEIARKNVAAFKAKAGNSADIQIIEGDVTNYAIRPEENVFFLFNPFDDVVFAKVLENLSTSLKSNPRKILIVINLPSESYRRTIAARPEFRLTQQCRFWGCDFSIYSS